MALDKLLTFNDMELLTEVWDEVFNAEPDVDYFDGNEHLKPAIWLDGIVAFSRTPSGSWCVAYIIEEEEGDATEAAISYFEPAMYETFAEALSNATGLVAIARSFEIIEKYGPDSFNDQFIFAGQHTRQVGVA
jgi:hypothetical protein